MTTGLFAGSFDPIHIGHITAITEAALQVAKLYVVIARNDEKTPSFKMDERVGFATHALRHLPNVQVFMSTADITDIIRRYAPDVLYRGVRNDKDISYETECFEWVKRNVSNPPTLICLKADSKHVDVSSSLIKSVVSYGYDPSPYVGRDVVRALYAKIMGSYRCGVAGPMGAGKTTFCQKYKDFDRKSGLVSIDEIGRDLIKEPYPGVQKDYALLREALQVPDNASIFGKMLTLPVAEQSKYQERIRPHYETEIRSKMRYLKGRTVFFEWVRILEDDMGGYCGYNLIVLNPSKEDMERNMKARGITPDDPRYKNQSIDPEAYAKRAESQGYRVLLIDPATVDMSTVKTFIEG